MNKIIFLFMFFLSISAIPLNNHVDDYMNMNIHMNDQNEKKSGDPVINCTSYASCNYNGVCADQFTCICYDGYTTHDSHDNTSCNYQQKSRTTAFLLHFFLGWWGFGEFYLGNGNLGGGQLGLSVGGIAFACIVAAIAGCCSKGCKDRFGDKEFLGGTCVIVCYFVIWFVGVEIWWIYDCVTIGTGVRTDGHGVAISGW